eukprot:gene10961-biopygen1794
MLTYNWAMIHDDTLELAATPQSDAASECHVPAEMPSNEHTESALHPAKAAVEADEDLVLSIVHQGQSL